MTLERFIREPGGRADAVPRHDIYAGIHKGLRAFMCSMLPRIGSVDADDEAEVAELLDALKLMLSFCRLHLETENAAVHPAMEARAPDSSARIADEHGTHLGCLSLLAAQADEVARAHGAQRARAALRLYPLLAVFVAENFTHMNEEETAHNAVLWGAYSDAELRAIEGGIIASHTPEENALALRWMVPAMTPAERLALLGPLRNVLPAVAFDALLGDLRAHLPPRAWQKLADGLRLAA